MNLNSRLGLTDVSVNVRLKTFVYIGPKSYALL